MSHKDMKEIRILLINVPKKIKDKHVSSFTPIPLGLLYIASTADKAGYKVNFIDGHIKDYTAIIDKVKEFQPHLVGMSCLTWGRKSVLKVASDVKQISEEIPMLISVRKSPATIIPIHLSPTKIGPPLCPGFASTSKNISC